MSEKKKNRINRRQFVALTGSAGAGLVFQGQEKYVHKLIPYVNAPQYPKPGEWAYYLSTCRECPAGCGLMMWHRDGRITKAEGNPENPINNGKLCIRGQSSVLGEYDPDRLKVPQFRNENGDLEDTTWESAIFRIKSQLSAADKVLTVSNLQTGSLAGVMEDFAAEYDQAPLFYEAFNYESMRRANAEMYGQPVIPRFDLTDSDLIISFSADFLETWLSPVEFAAEFGKMHSLQNNEIGKFIYFGPVQTLTAINADEFIVTPPATEAQIIYELMRRLGQTSVGSAQTGVQLGEEILQKLDTIAAEIRSARKPVILAGNPADKSRAGKRAVQAANRFNAFLGNNVMDFNQHHALSQTAFDEEVREFFESVTENTVLVVHETNPVFSLPESLRYIEKAGLVIYIGTMQNETAAQADWLLPSNYYLEDWGDFEPWSGTVSLMQPTMQPVFDTQSAGEIFLMLSNIPNDKTYREVVHDNWRRWAAETQPAEETNAQQETEQPEPIVDFSSSLLNKGYLTRATAPIDITAAAGFSATETEQHPAGDLFYLHIAPSLRFYDGRLANRGWLQEIPHPVSNIVWQSWVDMNTEKARELDIEEGDMIKISTGSSNLEVAVRLTEDIDKNTLALDAGQGHTALGKIANGVGVNAFSLMSLNPGGNLPVINIEKTGDDIDLLYLNATKDQHDRELLHHVELEKLKENSIEQDEIHWPLPEGYDKETDLYKGHDHEDHRWGMVIDLQKCIGCKACEAACYAENNIEVVGEANCREGREMSWLKVVPYRLTGKNSTAFLPVPCQHCDSAPCEPVCPVYASVHTEEGLNAQVYNRCIGTRYCSNNCPYKVRRFNWINVSRDFPMNLQLNPEVTVRERGVMEKCTFCVQRIRNQEYQALKEQREITDGEIVPACVQTCPTNAIVFGDLKDENSRVSELFRDRRRYQLLHELNTKTAVVYLKKITI